MTLRFAFIRPEDGGMSIVIAAQKKDIERVFGPMSDEAYRRHVIERSGVPADAVELSEDWTLPDDRTFRNAWTVRGGTVEVDMPKARDIHMGRVRRERNVALRRLDGEWNAAMGKKDQAAADTIEATRQTLRDVPQKFDLSKAKTPEELKALWPEELRG